MTLGTSPVDRAADDRGHHPIAAEMTSALYVLVPYEHAHAMRDSATPQSPPAMGQYKQGRVKRFPYCHRGRNPQRIAFTISTSVTQCRSRRTSPLNSHPAVGSTGKRRPRWPAPTPALTSRSRAHMAGQACPKPGKAIAAKKAVNGMAVSASAPSLNAVPLRRSAARRIHPLPTST